MIKKIGNNKKNIKGFFFSVDALLALAIIIIIVGIAIPTINYSNKNEKIQGDIISVIASLKVGEMYDAGAYPSLGGGGCTIDCVPEPTQEERNNTILEQIGKFYIENPGGDDHTALAEKVLESVPQTENVGIWLIDESGANIEIITKSESSYTPSELTDVEVANYLVSGIDLSAVGANYKGFSAFSYLQKTFQTKYFYFGGYVGEGNITLNVSYTGNIQDAELELAVNSNFTVWVNGVNRGINYEKSPSTFQPVRYDIGTDNFTSGENLVQLKSINSTKLYIAGGYLKVTYNGTDDYIEYENYSFPGIEGYINLYDSFYVPGDLKGIDLNLHFRSNLTTILSIGNVTIFNQSLEPSSPGDEYTITKSNASIWNEISSAGLNFGDFSRKTIPLRFGFENGSYSTTTQRAPVTAVPVTDLSSSMKEYCCNSSTVDYCSYVKFTCENNCPDPDTCVSRIDSVKAAGKEFTNVILNYSNNFVGLVAYDDLSLTERFLSANQENFLVNQKIEDYSIRGGLLDTFYTCICCGINRGVALFSGPVTVMDRNIIQIRISESSDDADQRVTTGTMDLDYDDLRLRSSYLVGMRFKNIPLAKNSLINNAYIKFEESGRWTGEPTNFTFSGQDIGNAPTFSNSGGNISSRIRTDAKVTWENVLGWNKGNIAQDYITPNLSLIIQEITSRVDWSYGNSIVIRVDTVGNNRLAYSYDQYNSPDRTALLVINYSLCDHDGILEAGLGEECDDGNLINNDECSNVCSVSVCGDGIIQYGEECDNSGICSGDNYTLCGHDDQCLFVGGTCQPRDGDGCSSTCQDEERAKVIVVMSDGEANYGCVDYNDFIGSDLTNETDDAAQDAIDSSCIYAKNNGVAVYAVGFDTDDGEDTLRALSEGCNQGNYSNANTTSISDIYAQIASGIIQTSYYEQTILNVAGDFNSTLYPDSYIKFNYDKNLYEGTFLDVEVPVINETYVEFSIPDNSQLVETRLISYSGPRWTNLLTINDDNVYNLGNYNKPLIFLGDPYHVNIPNEKVLLNENLNKVDFSTSSSMGDYNNGSVYNKLIYTIMKNITSLTEVLKYSDGCNWTIQFEDEEPELNISIPKTYSGESRCYYQNATYNGGDGSYDNISINNTQDAQQVVAYNLLKQLDFDKDGEVNVKFASESFELGTSEVEGVPYAQSAIVQVRKWY